LTPQFLILSFRRIEVTDRRDITTAGPYPIYLQVANK